MSLLSIALAVCLFTGCGAEQPPAQDPWADWRSYAGSPDSSQYSSLKQINRDNVSTLEVAWTFPTGEQSHRSGPIIIGDVMYVVANGGVTALDAATGKQRWFAPDSVAPRVRGLTYWESESQNEQRLLVVKGHYLQALAAHSGQPILSFGTNGQIDLREGLNRDPQTITRIASMTPGRIFEDLIIVGSSVGDESYGAAPGDIRAYDVRSGAMVWTFHTIPHPGEAGYETWPPDAWKTVGAANAWSNMSVDEKRGIIYIPTGAPSYHFYGANRPGDNLYANTLLALNARTGERLWHFQAVHHDIWDYDLAMAPKLLTVTRNGMAIDAVALAGKHGFLFVFDRLTGEPIFPIEERTVPQSDVPGEHTSATQPFQ
jgi:quinoprotein glucose dehydrogenase